MQARKAGMGGLRLLRAPVAERLPVMRSRALLLGIASLFTGLAALSAPSRLELPNLYAPIFYAPVFGLGSAKAQNPATDMVPASLCIAGAGAPAIREWINQHPKSKRGRLDHQRLRLQAVL